MSILPSLSKVYENVIYNQLSDYSDSFLNGILYGFRKAHSTQHALFKLLQSWQQVLDHGGFIGTILMDLSKAYDCIPNNLLIAKLKCYGAGKASLRLLLDYLGVITLALDVILIQMCHKGQYLVLFYLIYLSMIHFIL